MERITHKPNISQGEKHFDTPREEFIAGELTEFHDSAYAAVVQPQKVVVLPRYFITHWLPALGPSLAWLVLAFRQAAFVANCDQPESVRALSVRRLSRWAGLSHGQIWNLIQKSSLLPWFVRRIRRATERSESDLWGVRTAIPLAPHHIALLQAEFDRLLLINPDPAVVARSLLEKSQSIRHAGFNPAGTDQEPQTLHDVFAARFGALDPKTSLLLDEITARIVQPGNTVAISHYFIHRWRSEMTSGEAWLVHFLRMQVYNLQSDASYLSVTGGKTRLAQALGVNTRSVRRWFAGLENSSLAHFLHEQEPGSALDSHLDVEIALREPIHTDDQETYNASLQERWADKIGQPPGQKWTDLAAQSARLPDKNEQGAGQNWTAARTELDRGADKNEQAPGQDWTAPRTKLDTVIVLNQNSNQTENKPLLQQSVPVHQPVVVVGGWDIDKILQTGGLIPGKRSEVLSQMSGSEETTRRFIGWFLYGCESKGRIGQGITSPVLFALSRFLHSRPAPVYLQLAARTPSSLARDIENRYAPETRPDLQAILSALESNGLIDVLRDQVPHIYERDLTSHSPASADAAPGATHAPEPGRPNGRPASAEDIWDQVRQIAGIEPGIVPVSMWLNEETLELSFMVEDATQSVRQALEVSRDPLRSRFPAAAFQLRTLEMIQQEADALPVIGVKSEMTVSL